MRRFIVIAIISILFIGGLIWMVNGRSSAPDQEGEVTKTELIDYANTTTQVRYILRGQINARENHRILEITVSRDSRTAVLYEGYTGNVLRFDKFGNDSVAYSEFLAALDNEGYTASKNSEFGVKPEGVCSRGQRADFEIIQGSETKQSLWTTNCKDISGTFAGRTSNIRRLFEAQLPEYTKFVEQIKF